MDKNPEGLPYMKPVGQGRVFAPFRSENAYITYRVSVWFSTRQRTLAIDVIRFIIDKIDGKLILVDSIR